MAIKFLRGIYKAEQLKTTRPVGFKFPLGLSIISDMDQANSSTTATTGTVDVFVVAGGGSGGCYAFPVPDSTYHVGGGGGGGVRLLTGNSLFDIAEFKNPASITGTTNFIPVIVGGGGGNSCFGSNFVVCRGGAGAPSYGGAAPGGSGGGGTRLGPGNGNVGTGGGSGIAGQGCDGTPGGPGANGGAGGSATCSCTAPALCNCNGLTTSFTGTPIRYGDGGNGAPTPTNGCSGTANRGNGGNAGAPQPGPGVFPTRFGGSGGSGIVAIRYCNPAAPTTPLVTGGNTVCCTGGCIIHIFTSSGFLNVNSSFSIN